jgi:hypothetical protein
MGPPCEGCGTDEKVSTFKLDRLTPMLVCPVCLGVLRDTYKQSRDMTPEQRIAAVKNTNVVALRRSKRRS